LLGRTLANVDLFLAQTDEDRRRLIEIGAAESKIAVAGNLKFDVAPPPSPKIVASLRESFEIRGRDRFWFVAARSKMKKARCSPRFATFSSIIRRQ
jgi:3-deoxy-D-manno-octulosonic-acid transferase